MRRSNFKLRGLSLLSVLTAAASVHAQEDWLRHFRIGASVLLNVKTEFKTTGTFNLNPGPPSARGGITYDNGFVGVDETGNQPLPNETEPVTTFWGYNSNTQYDAANNELTFNQTHSFTGSGANDSDDVAPGFDMVYAATFRQWDRVAIGGELGFGISFFGARDRSSMAATLTQRVDRYSTGGTQIPNAPYTGPETRGGVTTGEVINSTPIGTSTITTPGTISGDRSLDGMIYNLRLGPLVRWEFLPHWTLNGSAGGAIGLVDVQYEFNESIAANATSSLSNSGDFSETEFKFGGYAGAVVMYDTGDYWEAYLGAHFMTLQDTQVSQGGREAKLDLGGAIFITAGINWSF